MALYFVIVSIIAGKVLTICAPLQINDRNFAHVKRKL